MEEDRETMADSPALTGNIMAISRRILDWYAGHQRDLPWRRTKDPYSIWVSEIMLQQTRVDTVIPFYHRFMERFPVVQALAEASREDVLKAWENLGYYSRARHLHCASQRILNEFGGYMPKTRRELLSLPGIGPYTAAAILSFAFDQNIAAVDANVVRILCRIFAIQEPSQETPIKKRISFLADALVPRRNSSPYNQGLMDLGAGICTPRRPGCKSCPLNDLCEACKKGLQEALPVSVKGPPSPHREMTAGIIIDSMGSILILKRPEEGFLGGLWKFPGGERGKNETLKEALCNRVLEETGVNITVLKKVTSVRHAYTHFRITLHAFRCRMNGSPIKAPAHPSLQWAPLPRLKDYPISKADRMIIEALNNG